MECEDYKKYNILENILQTINRKYVALPEDETKRNNRLLQVIDRIIQKLKDKSPLFRNLYRNKFYGGSFYDGLKVGNPSEYDLDCVLCLPKLADPTVEVSDKPGYVHLVLKNLRALETNAVEAPKYVGLDKLLDGNRLSTQKVKSWMESLMSSAITPNTKIEIEVEEKKQCTVNTKVVKCGPAHTIKLDGVFKDKQFNVDIDLVPCFTFFDDQWPKGDYRENPSKSKNTFFVVPKSPSEDHTNYWRLSFQEQERELMSSSTNSVMKPTIRLIKKVRDRYQHKIASYYIKTVFLWEADKTDKSFWTRPLSFVFVNMLRKYSEYIENRAIPYYWNSKNNLIGELSDATASNVSNKIKNIADQIDKMCTTRTNIYEVVHYLLPSEEHNLDSFKQEVPIGKKLLKQKEVVKIQLVVPESSGLPASKAASKSERQPVVNESSGPAASTAASKSESQPVVNESTGSPASAASPKSEIQLPEHESASSASTKSSSYEMLNVVANVNSANSNKEVLRQLSKIEMMCLSIMSEQKRIAGNLGSCESQITQIAVELEKKKICDFEKFQTLAAKIDNLERKVDNISRRNEASVDDQMDDLLSISDRLRSTLHFQP